jgi:glyoxylase-like metal-dependent hydrolase (beta-lactamase superfamily II)
MSVRLFAMNCGWQTGPLRNFLSGESGRIRVPTPSYLVVHPRGKVLFDSGLHLDCQVDPQARLGVIARVYDVECGPGDDVRARLATLDTDVGEITFLVNSHLHYDHSGGNHQIPNARLVVQRPEWEAGHQPEGIAANYYQPQDYDLGHDVLVADGEHDLFGDGSVVCVPTYGHTPGHQALRVRGEHGDVVLAADACYLRRTLEELHLPGIVHDPDEMLRSLHALRALRAAGARIFFGHDPEFWATVPQAPAPVL